MVPVLGYIKTRGKKQGHRWAVPGFTRPEKAGCGCQSQCGKRHGINRPKAVYYTVRMFLFLDAVGMHGPIELAVQSNNLVSWAASLARCFYPQE